MNSFGPAPVTPVDSGVLPWKEHPDFPGIFFKRLLTAADNPLAGAGLVRIPPGGVVGRHVHPREVETVYALAGESVLTLGDRDVPFRAGQAVAIPRGLEHAVRNDGTEPVELLTFFTPPVT